MFIFLKKNKIKNTRKKQVKNFKLFLSKKIYIFLKNKSLANKKKIIKQKKEKTNFVNKKANEVKLIVKNFSIDNVIRKNNVKQYHNNSLAVQQSKETLFFFIFLENFFKKYFYLSNFNIEKQFFFFLQEFLTFLKFSNLNL